jgi:signal transduction histidine kinase
MSLLGLLKRNPVVLPLVLVAGLSVIFISEAAYWRSGDTIETGVRDLNQTLLLSRIGMAALSAVLMLALLLYLRKSDALATQQRAQQGLMQSAHDRLEVEVAQRTTQLTALTSHLLTAREDERHRPARNLHDDLGALLTAAKLDAGIALGRHIIEDLRPSTLSHLGLAATLDILMREFSERIGLHVHSQIEKVSLSPGAELVVYRVVQEAATNLSKYAKASNVWLTVVPSLAVAFVQALPASLPQAGGDGPANIATRIAPGAPGASISVRDDGVGFDANQPTPSAYGLLGMRFRVEAAGGLMRVRSSAGGGTLISVWLPSACIENSVLNAPNALN